MKKAVLKLLLFFLVAPICTEARDVKVFGGLISSKNKFDDFESESKLTFCGGIGIDTVKKKAGFTAEVLFSYEKVNLDLNGIINEYRFIKLSMPLLFKYKLKEFYSPFMVIGGAGTIIFAENEAINGNTNTMFDLSFVIGAGIDIDLIDKQKMSDEGYRWPTLTIEGRYQMGFTELKLDDRPFKASSFFILIGVKF